MDQELLLPDDAKMNNRVYGEQHSVGPLSSSYQVNVQWSWRALYANCRSVNTRVWASRKPSRQCGHSATRVPPEFLVGYLHSTYLSSVFCVRYMNFISPAEARNVRDTVLRG